MAQILIARAEPPRYTESERRLLEPSAKPVTLGACQMSAEMAKIVQQEVSSLCSDSACISNASADGANSVRLLRS